MLKVRNPDGIFRSNCDRHRRNADRFPAVFAIHRESGGGSKSPLWQQIQADVFGQDVMTINAEQGPAYGVALLAAVGSGAYKSIEAVMKNQEDLVEVVAEIKQVVCVKG